MENQALTIVEGLLFIVGDEGLTLPQVRRCWISAKARRSGCSRIYSGCTQRISAGLRSLITVEYSNLSPKLQFILTRRSCSRTPKNTALSQSALETLAIIAYKQPITRVEIEEIRGVGCDMMLRKLQARGLIREAGRSEAPGRPILFEVTEEFMDSFKLVSLNELPELPDYTESESEDLFE